MRVFSGPLIWAAHLFALYAFTALACARRFADLSWLGVGVVPWAISGATVVAAAATLLAIRLALRDRRRSNGNASHFLHWLTAALGGLALLGILWEALPALLVPACG